MCILDFGCENKVPYQHFVNYENNRKIFIFAINKKGKIIFAINKKGKINFAEGDSLRVLVYLVTVGCE